MSTILFEWDRNGNFYLCQFATVTPYIYTTNLDSIYIYRMANREIATNLVYSGLLYLNC
jgi:hypothetical protein